MKTRIDAYLELAQYFEIYHHHLYLVGGTVRDYLINAPFIDIDCATDAKPEQLKTFLSNFNPDFTFEKMGSIKIEYYGYKIDITTLRKEGKYDDSRHPSKIRSIKSIRQDSKRRDFTLNAIYLNRLLQIKDFHHGYNDLMKKRLRMVGNPNKRIKEDPLRIIRALRFALTYKLTIVPSLDKAIVDNIEELKKLNPEKVKQEIFKIRNVDHNELEKMFEKYQIKQLLDAARQ